MNLRTIFFLLLVLIVGNCTLSFGQSSNNKGSNDSNVEKSDSKFIDHFEWVNPKRADLHEVNIVGGYSFHSTKGFWGKIPNATLRLFALRYNRKLFTFKKHHLIEYVAEFNLAANYNLTETPRYPPGSYTGWGLTPLGFQFNLWHANVVQPFFKSSAGFMHFNKPFPDDRGVQFNLTLELGGGIEFVVARNFSFTIGYKYHHMSNGQLGQINPGIDSNVFYSGFTIF